MYYVRHLARTLASLPIVQPSNLTPLTFLLAPVDLAAVQIRIDDFVYPSLSSQAAWLSNRGPVSVTKNMATVAAMVR